MEQFKLNKIYSSLTFARIFIVACLLNALPVLAFKYFPTTDGFAHLYNAQILHQLVFAGNDFLAQFYTLNPEPVPNWGGHFLMMLLFSVGIPAFIIEKIILLLIVLGLPLSFSALVKTLTGRQEKLVLLVLPLVYTYIFGLGFYNFGLGLLMLFSSLNYWIKFHKTWTAKRIFIFFILTALCYFSHIFSFGILSLTIALLVFSEFPLNSVQLKLKYKYLIRQATVNLLVLLPFLLLFLTFLGKRESYSANDFLDLKVLWDILWQMRILDLYFLPQEKIIGIAMFTFISMFSILAFYQEFGPAKNKADLPKNSKTWLLLALITGLLFFTMPNVTANGGYISQRLCILYFLFLILWICLHKIPSRISIVALIAVLSLHGFRIFLYFQESASRMADIEHFEKASEFIKPNSIVLPIRHTQDNKHRHLSNLMGIDKPLLILENYEANYGYFPIVWKQSIENKVKMPANYIDEHCSYGKFVEGTSPHLINYVLFWGNSDLEACDNIHYQQVQDHYHLKYSSPDDYVRLYEITLNKNTHNGEYL